MMSQGLRTGTQAILLVLGLVCLWALPLVPAAWIYDRLAIRAAFGHENGPPPAVSVVSIKKPSTVTFSNGVVADVGYFPATVSNVFHLAVALIGQGLYIYRFRRPIRRLVNATSGRGTAGKAEPDPTRRA